MAWVKTKWIDAFFAALNQRFPGRDRTTDGTIGDPKHATGTSGHNPDDTPGVKAERQDADTKQEVRAADVDADLRDPGGATMQDVINAILATPEDRNRLIYIIFNGSIWRASGGWRREVYSGSNKHTKHAHFSGHPDADENGAPWTSILTLGEDMADIKIAGEPIEKYLPRIERALWWPITNTIIPMLTAIASKVDIDPAELAAIEEAARRGAASAVVDVQALAAALAPLLGLDQAVVVAALESDAGQAALVRANETSEDA